MVVATHALNVVICLVFDGKWDDQLRCYYLWKWLRRERAAVEDKWRPWMKIQAQSGTKPHVVDRGDVAGVFGLLVA